MDLEQFRRAYMHMEGVTNTPGNFVKRSSRLVESVVNIPGAIKRDVDESKMNAKIKKTYLTISERTVVKILTLRHFQTW